MAELRKHGAGPALEPSTMAGKLAYGMRLSRCCENCTAGVMQYRKARRPRITNGGW